MHQAGNQFLRQILQNPETGRTILAEGSEEDIFYKKVIETGEQLEYVDYPSKWKETSSGEVFILSGIEVTDGLSTKVYAPPPEPLSRIRFASGKAFFALTRDHVFLDALTQSPVKLEESYTIEGYRYSTGSFYDILNVEISDEDEDEDEDTNEEITFPATVTLKVRKEEHTGDLHTYHLTLIDSKHLSEPVLFLLQVSESDEAELFEDDNNG